MKKIILFMSMFLILTGCINQNELKNNNTHNTDIKNEAIIDDIQETDTYVDDNPITVSLYNNKNKVTTYKTTIYNKTDIASFDLYYTDVDKVSSSNTKTNFNKYYKEYENIENYKNGFYISFEAEGKTIEKLILDPTSQYAMYPYMYIYLYDDINQPSETYYSHLKENDINENTIISSIKLYSAEEGSKISSPITLTVFTYDGEEDFNEENKYRGISSYTIIIETK